MEDKLELLLPPLKILLDMNIEKAMLLAKKNRIAINTDLKKQEAVVKFTNSNQANLLVSKWSFLIGKDSVHVAKTVDNWKIWTSRNQYKVLLFILPIRIIVHNLGNFLEGAGKKTCFINHSLETGNKIHYTVVCFDSNKALEFVFYVEPIFGGVKLFWARIDLVWCEKCGKCNHSALECDAPVTSIFKPSRPFKKVVSDEHYLQLAKLYKRRNIPISCPAVFVVLLAGCFDSSCSTSGSGSFFSGISGSNSGLSLVLAGDSFLSAWLVFLEYSLELLADQVSGILKKLSSVELVLLVLPSCAPSLATPVSLVLYLNMDMTLNSVLMLSASFFLAASNIISDFSSSSSQVLMSKIDSLESKIIALEVSIGLVLEKLDHLCSGLVAMCNVRDINNLAKQEDIIWWHRDMGNMISVVTETKLRGKVLFTSGLDSGYVDLGVAIIMNVSLVQHVCKVFEVSGRLISVKLLFKNKLLVTVLGLYVSATLEKRLAYLHVVNSMVAEALNGNTFVVLGNDFNKNDSGYNASFKKFLDLGLLDFLQGFPLYKLPI
ncbi:hypothetical protein G9A89_003764 [Geosiphon pyriformis]|nr:hypothetical protein G9A89_003764 [Geosiphon pyriformis]